MDFHHKLRQETARHHEQIEQAPLLKKIITGDVTLAEYLLLIKKFYGYLLPCEMKISDLSVAAGLLAKREKVLLLEQDLRALGVHPDSFSDITRCTHLPPLTDYEHVLGYLYVMEGSTLGGQVIAKMLQTHLQLTPDSGASYFYGYGKHTKTKWNEFCAVLNAVDEQKQNKVISSVNLTYTSLYNWMINP